MKTPFQKVMAFCKRNGICTVCRARYVETGTNCDVCRARKKANKEKNKKPKKKAVDRKEYQKKYNKEYRRKKLYQKARNLALIRNAVEKDESLDDKIKT